MKTNNTQLTIIPIPAHTYAWPTQADLNKVELPTEALQSEAPIAAEAVESQQSMPSQTTESLGAIGLQSAEKSAAEMRDQKIERYVDRSCIIAQHWLNPGARKPESELGGRTIAGYTHTGNPSGKQFYQDLRQQNIRLPESIEETPEYIMNYFKKRGIYETCTMRTEPKITSDAGGFASITYETHGPGYRDDSLSPRDGLFLSVKFLLPEAQARKLAADSYKDPLLLRGMAMRYMDKYVLTDEAKAEGGDWGRYGRPPYEEWDNRPESFMAFKTSFDKMPEDLPDAAFVPIPRRPID
jgi:hypothetical protein